MQANLQHTPEGVNQPAQADAEKFLAAVWGADSVGNLKGAHFVAEQTASGWRHHTVNTVAEGVKLALEISAKSNNAYFACAEYSNSNAGRKGDNVSRVRAFWFDIDCGAAKATKGDGYPTAQAAHDALMEFCGKTDLPKPNAWVTSGNGLHVYWLLDDFIDRDEWITYSRALKALTEKHGFIADPARTADIASVLRVPGTKNWKDKSNPKSVSLKRHNGDTAWTGFKAVLDNTLGKPSPDTASGNLGDLCGGLSGGAPPPGTPENIARVRSMLAVIPADCGREEWRNAVWAMLSTGWGEAEKLVREWSATGSKYEPAEFDKVVESFNPSGGIGFGTLVHIAKRNGWAEPGSLEGAPIQSALRAFNERYFVSRVGGGVYVFDERDDGMLAQAMSCTAFQQFHAGRVVDGASVAAKWLKWSERRTFQSVIFDPSGRASSDSYNTWRGLAVAPAAGSCTRIREHIRAIWCSGNDAQFQYVTRWMAMLVQRPWEKPEVALVLRSREGSGKTIIVDILLGFFGVHAFTAAQKEQVAGRFNGHLFDKVLVVLEEAFFAGDPAAVASTKALVTNKVLGYEAKGKDSFNADNFAHVISLTNHAWAVPAGEDSRRWMVLDVDDSKRGDHAYFAELSAEIASGGNLAFLQYLMGIDITGWNPRALPESKALHAQKVETLTRTDPVAGWWLHVLADGSFSVDGGAIDWADEIPSADLHDCYQRATARTRVAPNWDTAMRRLRGLLPAGALGKVRRSGGGNRYFSYRLPDLDDARAHFRSVTGVNPCAT